MRGSRTCRAAYERDGFALWAVEDAATGAFLGNVGPHLQHVDGSDEVELGWSIAPARARQGIATEAAGASRDWVFATLDVDHVISLIMPENVPSRGVAEKLGMTLWKDVVWGSLDPRLHRVPPAGPAIAGGLGQLVGDVDPLDHDIVGGTVLCPRLHVGDGLNDVVSLGDLAEDGVPAVQVRRLRHRHEELRTVGAGTRVGHREASDLVEGGAVGRTFVLELVAGSARAGAGGVATPWIMNPSMTRWKIVPG